MTKATVSIQTTTINTIEVTGLKDMTDEKRVSEVTTTKTETRANFLNVVYKKNEDDIQYMTMFNRDVLELNCTSILIYNDTTNTLFVYDKSIYTPTYVEPGEKIFQLNISDMDGDYLMSSGEEYEVKANHELLFVAGHGLDFESGKNGVIKVQRHVDIDSELEYLMKKTITDIPDFQDMNLLYHDLFGTDPLRGLKILEQIAIHKLESSDRYRAIIFDSYAERGLKAYDYSNTDGFVDILEEADLKVTEGINTLDYIQDLIEEY